jgi:hypothetical protein
MPSATGIIRSQRCWGITVMPCGALDAAADYKMSSGHLIESILNLVKK